jgi:hypothetical protein
MIHGKIGTGIEENNAHTANTVYTSCGFQSNLQVQSSLARAVTVDRKVATNSRTLHTLNVIANPPYTTTLTSKANVIGLHWTFYLCMSSL